MSIAQEFDELARPYELSADAPNLLNAHGFYPAARGAEQGLGAPLRAGDHSKSYRAESMHLPLEERNTYSKAFLQVENLWRSSAAAQELVFARRLAQIAAELMGVDGVRLYADQALYKEPGGGITPWHADQYYWPLDSGRAITAWIPLQDTPTELGPLEFADGSHRFSYGRDLPIGDESERELQAALGAQGFRTDSSSYQVGDISYHLGWVFHHAGPNRSQTPRRVMTIIYVDALSASRNPPTRCSDATSPSSCRAPSLANRLTLLSIQSCTDARRNRERRGLLSHARFGGRGEGRRGRLPAGPDEGPPRRANHSSPLEGIAASTPVCLPVVVLFFAAPALLPGGHDL